MQSSYQKTARDTIFIGIATLLQFLIGLVQLPLLTKTLGAHDYGIWSQVNVTIGLILPLTSLGLGSAMVRFLAAEKNKGEIQNQFYSVVSVSFMVNLIASLVLIALAYPLAVNFFDGAVQIVRITGILILLAPISLTYLGLIRTFQQIKRYSIFIIAEDCGRVGLIAYLVLTGYDIFSVVLSLVAIKVIILSVLFFSIKSQIGIKRPDFSRIKEYLSFGLPLVPTSMSYWLVRLSDRYVISFFLGLTPVGIYSAAHTLGCLPFAVAGILSFVLLAALSKLYDEGRMDEVKTHLSYSLKYLLAVVIPFVFGAAILAEPILKMFSTPEIASQGYRVTPVIALATLLLSASGIISSILMLTRKTKIMAFVWLIAVVLNIGLNILVVPLIGILGAAITTLFVYLLVMGVMSYYSFKELKFSINWHFIIKSLLASAIMSVAIWLMAPQGNVTTILAVVAGVVIYGVILILLKGFSKEEMRFFWSLFQKSISR